MPLPTARRAVPMAAVVLPLPGSRIDDDQSATYVVHGVKCSVSSGRSGQTIDCKCQRWYPANGSVQAAKLLNLMAAVVGMPFEDGPTTIDLFQEDYAGQFVCQSHLTERDLGVSCVLRRFAPSICGTDCENKFLSSAVLMVTQELGKFLRC